MSAAFLTAGKQYNVTRAYYVGEVVTRFTPMSMAGISIQAKTLILDTDFQGKYFCYS